MMLAYTLMALLIAAALLLLTRPWWQAARAAPMARKSANVAAYRTRLTEIDSDVQAGLLEAPAAGALKNELAARLLDDAAPVPAADAASSPYKNSRLWLLALLAPVFAASWYGLGGSWRTQQMIALAASDPQAAQQLSVTAMVEGLAAKLKKNPDDAEGWAMLGRSYTAQQKYSDAAEAYAKANQINGGQNPDWLMGEGEALALARDRDLLGRPQQLFEAALKLQPDHVGALWYSALAAAQQQDYASTRAHFNKLLTLDLPEDLRGVIQTRIQELAQLTGQAAPAPAAAPVPSGVTLKLNISLAPELQKELSRDQTLFVFAKAENGPPMPLAVQKLQSVTLPLTVTLDDSMAMTPALKLSSVDRWVVTARLTRSGSVQVSSGDLQGQLTVGKADAAQPIQLLIDRKIP